ncbi:MAG: hypothetical protein PGN07_08855 [Aeromicrobium erythreum]
MKVFDAPIHVHYGFLNLTSRDHEIDPGHERDGQVNGLCGVATPGRAHLVTGLHTGRVPLTVEWLASEPGPPASTWPDVIEASVELPQVCLLSTFDVFEDVTLGASGWHRLRFHARGMDEGHELDTAIDDEAPDAYLLQLWPAAPAPDAVLRVGSETAQYWHDVARGLS